MSHPIPNTALDDRLGFVGTSGSGKTYGAGTAVERLLHKRARVVIVDPLAAWWGLRLLADGKTASPFNVAIFGGLRGDLPLTQHAGELIGETAATMAESCIVDLSQLGTKSAERRFMTGFLDAIYRKAAGEPFHLVIDEADLFAPQKPPKGDETLLNLTEQIVRRGRIKGFIPWLITQRPAVINKNVLSQVDGLIAFMLTSSQDRDALDAWIEGQADKAGAKAIKDGLPALPIGTGVVWVPRRGILDTKAFPAKETFDSSRTPKRGEKLKARALKPLDLGALKGRLATVEAETKASDPKALRAEVARLTAELAKAGKSKSVPAAQAAKADPKLVSTVAALRKALEATMKFIVEINAKDFFKAGGDAVNPEEIEKVLRSATLAIGKLLESKIDQRNKEVDKLRRDGQALITKLKDLLDSDVTIKVDVKHNAPFTIAPSPPPSRRPSAEASGDGSFTRPQMRILESLAMWAALGHASPSREMVAAVAGYSPSSGGFNNLLGQIKTAGAIDYPQPGLVALAVDGIGVIGKDEARAKLAGNLTNPQARIVGALVDQGERTREELGADTSYSPSSGGFNNLLGQLRTLGLIDYPRPGSVIMSDWAQELLSGWRAAA